MTKQEFLDRLKDKLKSLKNEDISERLDFYSEMIDDRMEEGLSEEEAVLGIGSVDEIAAQIVAERSKCDENKERHAERRKMKAWEIVLLAVGSPIWISLLAAAFAVVISIVASVLSVAVSLWAVFGAFAGAAFGGILGGIVLIIFSNPISGLALISAALICASLAIFMFFGCRETTKAVVRLTKWLVLSLTKKNRGKERS